MQGRIALLVAVAILATPMAGITEAQEPPGPVLEVAAGWVGFPDDGIVGEDLVGAAARWYLRPRLSVGPEIVYISGENHQHLMLTGNVTWDVFTSGPLASFIVIGGGLFQTRESLFTGPFTSREGAFTAGGGVRATVTDAVLLGVEARVGWETHLRVNGFVGVRLGN